MGLTAANVTVEGELGHDAQAVCRVCEWKKLRERGRVNLGVRDRRAAEGRRRGASAGSTTARVDRVRTVTSVPVRVSWS